VRWSQSEFINHSKLLEELKYCRHYNRKTKEGGKHPDRDAQFEYINAKVEAFQAAGEPVISIDAKKKELLGEYKNAAATTGRKASRSRSTPTISRIRNWQGRPLRDLRHRRQPRLCQPRDRSRYRAIRRQRRSPLARTDRPEALSRDEAPHDHRRRRGLQWFTPAALEVGAPTTRRRNRPDHRGLPLSAGDIEVEQDRASHVLHITQNWRAMPLASLLIVIALISNTTTKTGLKISCGLDCNAMQRASRSPTRKWRAST